MVLVHVHRFHQLTNKTTHTSGTEMHRALPPPLLKIKKCVYRYDFGVTADNVIYFKTSYSFGVPRMTPFALKQVILLVSP